VETRPSQPPRDEPRTVTLFLCGDVMTGRGVDQILPHPGSRELYEPAVNSAVTYVELAERSAGPIPRPVDFAYVWGDTAAELARAKADVRIVNLETAVTTSAAPWPRKGIHYRMHPANAPCLTAARIDCCALANNHVLDWGRAGLAQTLDTLHQAGIRTAGAGSDAAEAWAPAVLDATDAGRVLVFGFGERSSGIFGEWAASADRSGVALLDDLSERTAEAIAARIGAAKRAGDVAVASIHWGDNWGFEVLPQQRAFARRLVDAGSVDVVHGHSSHHVKGIEVYRDRPILYGCGDYLNDYEGIGGYGEFRGDLGLMYFPQLDAATGHLVRFALTPTRIRRFRVERAPEEAQRWIVAVLNREGRRLGGTRVEREPDGTFVLRWETSAQSRSRL
jgi:poly-gamma-glutamate capsule biosynthesis protein CapA/YwtB (metallophosphatase superfamily)